MQKNKKQKTKQNHYTHTGTLISWDWPPQSSALLHQCGIILTENRTIGIQDPKSFECPSRSPENYS